MKRGDEDPVITFSWFVYPAVSIVTIRKEAGLEKSLIQLPAAWMIQIQKWFI